MRGTKFFDFACHSEMTNNRKVAYDRAACSMRLQKSEPHRTRMMIRGNALDCGSNKAPKADLMTMQFLLNSELITIRAKFMTINIIFI